MTKDDFSKRCTEADHVWEAFDQHRHPNIYACANCLTYARRNGATMRTNMCAERICSLLVTPHHAISEIRHLKPRR